MKINVTYQYRESDNIDYHVIQYHQKNKRIFKKRLKLILHDISNTLQIYDWDVLVKILDHGAYFYVVEIELKDKNSSLSGLLKYANTLDFNNRHKKDHLGLFNMFRHDHMFNKLDLNSIFKNKEHTFFLTIYNFPEDEGTLFFSKIEHQTIQSFKNKYEFFYNYLIENKIYNFSIDNVFCSLQQFYISDKIYTNSSYTFNNNGFPVFGSNEIRNIDLDDEKTFILSMIESGVININQDVEEVLTWDIKDIFEMSKLIGY